MGLVSLINLLFRILWFLILARVILSWVRVSPYHPTWGPIVTAIYQLTDPIIEPVRRILPSMGGLDFSPIVVLLLLDLLRSLVISLLI
jgi:YggT family protein